MSQDKEIQIDIKTLVSTRSSKKELTKSKDHTFRAQISLNQEDSKI